MVYGDTNSTLAGALAASKLHIPVAHVEAGLRSFNKKMPEEVNRVLTDHISSLLFAPTKTAVENLKKEGITKGVYLVGDVMFDIALEFLKKINVKKILNFYDLEYKNFVLVTIHRAENTDNKDRLTNIFLALNKIAENGIKLFFPIHPRTRKKAEEYGLFRELNKNLIINPPIPYTHMLALEKAAKVIITDSGGVQKEGYFVGTPCVIPRDETEWVELIEIGFNKLCGVNIDCIANSVSTIFQNNNDLPKNSLLYGKGNASDKIINILLGLEK